MIYIILVCTITYLKIKAIDVKCKDLNKFWSLLKLYKNTVFYRMQLSRQKK